MSIEQSTSESPVNELCTRSKCRTETAPGMHGRQVTDVSSNCSQADISLDSPAVSCGHSGSISSDMGISPVSGCFLVQLLLQLSFHHSSVTLTHSAETAAFHWNLPFLLLSTSQPVLQSLFSPTRIFHIAVTEFVTSVQQCWRLLVDQWNYCSYYSGPNRLIIFSE